MDAINEADAPEQLNFPGYDLHELKGRRAGIWAMKINKIGGLLLVSRTVMRLTWNWKIIIKK